MRLCLATATLLALAPTGGCMAREPSCFTRRPSVVLPDRNRVLANLTHGAAGQALAEAILDGRLDDARAMLRHDPRLIDTAVRPDPRMPQQPAGQYGDLLTFAVARCDGDAIAMLLGAGMSANGVRPGGALSLAVLADTPALAEQLLSAGASPDPQALPGGEDPMRSAIAFSNLGAVMTLLRHGADPRWTDRFGVDRVRLALDAEQAVIAELLVEHGGTLFGVAEDGSTAAHLLAEPALIFNDAEQRAARDRLRARAERGPLGWPLPDRATIRARIAAGEWPTPAQAQAGLHIAPALRDRLRAAAATTH